jgi:hypothetical protein
MSHLISERSDRRTLRETYRRNRKGANTDDFVPGLLRTHFGALAFLDADTAYFVSMLSRTYLRTGLQTVIIATVVDRCSFHRLL